MQDGVLDILLGTMIGGLLMSAVWGLYWLSITTVGLTRRTCGWQMVLNSLIAVVLPALLAWGVIWFRGTVHVGSASFAVGLTVMPLVLLMFGLRPANDGQRAGIHMIEGMRHLKNQLLGKDLGCGGCSHEQDQGGGA